MKLLVLTMVLAVSQYASASYVEECKFSGTISSVGSIKIAGNGQVHHSKNVVLKVLSATSVPGSHSDCQHHIGEQLSLDLQGVKLAEVVSLKDGNNIFADYTYYNSSTPSGKVENTSAFIDSNSLKAYNFAMANKGVAEAIKRAYRLLGDGVKFITGKVEQLQSGCGFVGCDSEYVIMLTYGLSSSNAPRANVIVSLKMNALGEPTSIEVLQDPGLQAL